MSRAKKQSEVCVIGLGYTGLPTAAFFAKSGKRVVGVDIDSDRVSAVNRGEVPFVEQGLDKIVQKAVNTGSLSASQTPVTSDCFILAVPTPVDAEYQVDLSYIQDAVKEIAPLLSGDELIVLESTSPPGTTELVGKFIFKHRPDLKDEDIAIAHCPERVLPGNVMHEMEKNDRVVGGLNEAASIRAKNLYESFVTGRVMVTDATTAEMTKLTENTFRDINIAFANELSMICEKVGVNVWDLIELANHHPRVNILQPGPGVGGHCIAVDPWFIASAAPNESRLIVTARQVNDDKPLFVVNQIREKVGLNRTPKILVFGITFKPGIDDMRESPALKIVEMLVELYPDGLVQIVDPQVNALPPSLVRCDNVFLIAELETTSNADVAVMLVDHQEFFQLIPNCLAQLKL